MLTVAPTRTRCPRHAKSRRASRYVRHWRPALREQHARRRSGSRRLAADRSTSPVPCARWRHTLCSALQTAPPRTARGQPRGPAGKDNRLAGRWLVVGLVSPDMSGGDGPAGRLALSIGGAADAPAARSAAVWRASLHALPTHSGVLRELAHSRRPDDSSTERQRRASSAPSDRPKDRARQAGLVRGSDSDAATASLGTGKRR